MHRISISNRNPWFLSIAVARPFGGKVKEQRWSPGPGTSSNAIPIKEKIDGLEISDALSAISNQVEKEEDEENMTEYQKRIKSVSRCLKSYLEKRAAHEKVMDQERAEFELGKRHLANIMGWDPQLYVSQEQVDRAIEYLFPSSLHDEKALPVMKPPDEILPRFNNLDFDEEGRPLDSFFYTTRPKFSRLLSEINDRTQQLIQSHDMLVLKGADPESIGHKEARMGLSATKWVNKEKLRAKLHEKVTDEMHASFVLAMDFMAEQKLARSMFDFIDQWRESVSGSSGGAKKIYGIQLPLVKIDKISNRRCTVVKTLVKNCKVTVKVLQDGTGKFTVDGHPFGDFRSLQAREILLCPLVVTDLLGKLDIECKTEEGVESGESVLPRAIRHGISLGIAALFRGKKEVLRVSGLLTLDVRKAERKKINQPGARKKWLWKKR
uniref:Mitochondrial ribosomal protein S9 n=1 Tax=Ditylenchus dipsaci TaxID=166011 RepID=A0A915DY60_9BILA